ncbi:MAG TPA: aminotransferase class V-fold PLP-dependent enzyme [Labilithrix sp.]|nr:aminotransferase class V-fold PLP-dependent enzyme [Labilithrix sp.]
MTELRELLSWTAARIADYRGALAEAPVGPSPASVAAVREALGGALPTEPTAARDVIELLADAVSPGLIASAGPRYFGYVLGGTLDAALCADLLTAGWDQNAFNAVTSPAAALVEEAAGAWLKDLLGLPATASCGFVTGGQAANTVALAAARHHLLAEAGWDVERDGLAGAPRVRIVASAERHATIDRALRLLGFGTANIEEVASSRNGAIDVSDLATKLAAEGGSPTILCLQAGNVNTGACDDFVAACDVARRHRTWVHVDGAFGLWARASEATRALALGVERADSWSCDGHKWLNVPHDAGYVFTAYPQSHRAAMAFSAAYLTGHGEGATRHPADYVPESSRRARGFATWAALRELGARGVAELVDSSCAHARRFASRLAREKNVTIGNDVVLNQVLVHLTDDDTTDRVVRAVQREGTCWLGGTSWRGRRYMRISVANWSTRVADVDRVADVIVAEHERERRAAPRG